MQLSIIIIIIIKYDYDNNNLVTDVSGRFVTPSKVKEFKKNSLTPLL